MGLEEEELNNRRATEDTVAAFMLLREASTEAGIQTITELKTSERKILVFADMLELGEQSREMHESVAGLILKANFAYVILFGLEVMATVRSLDEAGYTTYYHNVSKSSAIQHFLRQLRAGDLIYLKGSRSMQLEDFISAYKESK